MMHSDVTSRIGHKSAQSPHWVLLLSIGTPTAGQNENFTNKNEKHAFSIMEGFT